MHEPIVIGKLGKPHGLKGEIRVNLEEEEFADHFQAGDYLLIKGLPHRILEMRDIGGLVIIIEGHPDRSSVEYFKGAEVALPYSEALAQIVEEAQAPGFEGFYIIDQATEVKVGPIVAVQESTYQLTAFIIQDGKDIFIPLHEDLILEIDLEKKIILMDLPEGLLGLYLD